MNIEEIIDAEHEVYVDLFKRAKAIRGNGLMTHLILRMKQQNFLNIGDKFTLKKIII